MRKHDKNPEKLAKINTKKKNETDTFSIQIKIDEVWFLEVLEQICRSNLQIEQNEKNR